MHQERNMVMKKHTLRLLPLALAAALSACAVGPDYVQPKTALQTGSYKEEAGWKPAQPRDTEARGKWWEVYGDSQLNALMDQVQVNNLNVQQAEAQYRQARAAAQVARAGFFPTVSAAASANRNNSSNKNSSAGSVSSTTTNLGLDASWEPDIWGKVRRSSEAGNASLQASAADLAAATLSAQAELAQDYFQLRVLDAQADLYAKNIEGYQRSLTITQNQYKVGIVTRADVAQAQTQLQSTQAQAMDLGVQRAQLEHAIAILLGKPPADFTLAKAALPASIPAVPAAGLPSDLLERRPDIAAAERRVAAANANIGVAKAAYYPSLTLSGSIGLQGNSLSQWFNAPTRVWSLGASLAETLFEGGLRKAQTDSAIAAYDATVAQYKLTVLGGLQEVEDNLVALRVLEEEAKVQDQAVKAAQDAETLALNQYKAGTANYLAVVTAQSTALSNERSALQLLGRQYSAHVLLIKALGGSAVAPSKSKGAG